MVFSSIRVVKVAWKWLFLLLRFIYEVRFVFRTTFQMASDELRDKMADTVLFPRTRLNKVNLAVIKMYVNHKVFAQ